MKRRYGKAIYNYRLGGVIPIEIHYSLNRAEPDVGIMSDWIEIEGAYYYGNGKPDRIDLQSIGVDEDLIIEQIWSERI